MASKPQQTKGRDTAFTTLNIAIEGLNAKEASNITPAKAVFGSVTNLLAMIRVCFALLCDDGLPTHVPLGLHGQ